MNLRLAALALAAAALVPAACGSTDTSGLSREEVNEIIDERLAEEAATPVEMPTMSSDIEEAIRDAVSAHEATHSESDPPEIPSGDFVLAADLQPLIEPLVEALAGPLVEALVQDALDAASAQAAEQEGQRAAMSDTDPAQYTKLLVGEAIDRYRTLGLDATLAHYNDAANVDGEWYVFIADQHGTVVGHYDDSRRGHNLNGWLGTDVNGYVFGEQMLSATEAGKWVPYFYVNPVTGTLDDTTSFELKNAWVVRHDGLLFGSGWYVDSEELLPALITEAAEHFRAGGLEAALAFYNDPQGLATGLIPTVQYYNSTNTLQGEFSGFIATPEGELVSHVDPTLIGTNIRDLLGDAVFEATAEGGWFTQNDNGPAVGGPQTMRVWFINVDGNLIGGGWYRP